MSVSRAFFALVLFAFLSACVASNSVSHRNQSIAPGTKYKKIMVVGLIYDLGARKSAEAAFVSRLRRYRVEAVSSLNHFAPSERVRRYRVKQIADTHGYDAILYFRPTLRGRQARYIPPSYVPGTTNTKVNIIGDTAYVTTTRTPGYITGGHNVYLPWANYSAQLYDARSMREDGGRNTAAWLGRSNTGGSASVSFRKLRARAVSDIVKLMAKDGVI